jgi:hypothetical protein
MGTSEATTASGHPIPGIEIETRCSPIYNLRYLVDQAAPGVSGEGQRCDCCPQLRNNTLIGLAECPSDWPEDVACNGTHACVAKCSSPPWEQSTGCGGGWPSAPAGSTAFTDCWAQIDGVSIVGGVKSMQCGANGRWNYSAADISNCEGAVCPSLAHRHRHHHILFLPLSPPSTTTTTATPSLLLLPPA